MEILQSRLDTRIMVGAVLKSHPEHAICLAALEDSPRPFTNAHALAETLATLTGFYKVPTDVATALTLSLLDLFQNGFDSLHPLHPYNHKHLQM